MIRLRKKSNGLRKNFLLCFMLGLISATIYAQVNQISAEGKIISEIRLEARGTELHSSREVERLLSSLVDADAVPS